MARHDGLCNTSGASRAVVFPIAEPNVQPSCNMAARGSDMPIPSVSRSEDRVALILDTLNPHSCPPLELCSHPRMPPPQPLPPPDAHQPTLTQMDRHNLDREHIRSLGPIVEVDDTRGLSRVPHRSTALSCTPSNHFPLATPLAHFPVAHYLYCRQSTHPEVLTVATCACCIVAGCRSNCVLTTIYCHGGHYYLICYRQNTGKLCHLCNY